MNEKLNLVETLKNCPKGTKLYSTICGEVKLAMVENDIYPIGLENSIGDKFWVTKDGRFIDSLDGECTLFPSREQRDWSKFKVKKQLRFDPNTLQPFDKVLVRDSQISPWFCKFFSHIMDFPNFREYATTGGLYRRCIPYNEETKHLVGTTKEAPEFYRYWED